MNHANPGLMALEMHEREAFHRARAQRERFGTVGETPRRRIWRRTTRAAA